MYAAKGDLARGNRTRTIALAETSGSLPDADPPWVECIRGEDGVGWATLDGCPMFADFRVHGLNMTFPNAFPTGLHLFVGNNKGGASPIFFNPCTRKSANMGHPS